MKARYLLDRLNELPEKELDREVIFEYADASWSINEVLVLARFPGNLAAKDKEYLRLR